MRRTLTLIAGIALLGVTGATPVMAEDPPPPPDGQFMVSPQQALISWTGWAGVQHFPGDRDVVVTVDHEADGTPEYTTTVHTDAAGHWQVTGVDLQPGYVVRADTAPNGDGVDDVPDSVHTVYALTIDGWDEGTDEVWGSSDVADRGLQVCVGTSQHNFCMNQWFPTGDPDPWEGDNTWRYQFPDGYLVPGANISATELDEVSPGNYTEVSTQIPGAPQLVTLNAWPTSGLWNGTPVNVSVSGLTPNTMAFLSINSVDDPTGQFQMLPGIPISNEGFGNTTVSLPRFVAGLDCAPNHCMLVVADPGDPFGRNASVPLTFGRIDLFRYVLVDPAQPWLGGTPGDPLVGTVEHGEFVWVVGTGFMPNQQYQLNQCKDMGSTQLCRNTWSAMPWAFTDGDGTFAAAVQVGAVMYGPWGTEPQWAVSPAWDLRDGSTVMVSGTGLPTQYSMATEFPSTWIGARAGGDQSTNFRSDPLAFEPDQVQVRLTMSQALEQQLESIVHVEPIATTTRVVDWNWNTGTVTYAYTGVSRWVTPNDPGYAPYDPLPPEDGAYDCADVLPYDPAVSGAQEPVHCSMYFRITETALSSGAVVQPFDSWTPIHFARFDLTATTNSVLLSSKPAGVTVKGQVTCTGFSPEQYLVTVEGTITQTTTGKRPTTVVGTFQVTVTCSGTMTNPGRANWTVFVPGAFVAGAATVTLEVTSPGFTRNEDPLVVTQTLVATAPPKGGKK